MMMVYGLFIESMLMLHDGPDQYEKTNPVFCQKKYSLFLSHSISH